MRDAEEKRSPSAELATDQRPATNRRARGMSTNATMPRMTDEGRAQRIRFLSCFFPAFNEEENIAAVLEEAVSLLPRFADEFEVIVVDDGSSDRTADVVREVARGNERVRLVSHEENRGYGEALRSGLNAARGDAVFFTDADRQFHLDDIARLLDAYESAPFVVGYRLKRNDPKHRLFVARVYHAALKAVFGLRVRDVDCAFKLLDRTALDPIRPDLASRSAFISPELLIRAQMAGVAISEIGVPHYPRAAGRPKGATPKVIARTIKEIFVMRRRLGSARTRARDTAAARPAD
jgi:glycosyltransferase involved in cell wall biosynthesis